MQREEVYLVLAVAGLAILLLGVVIVALLVEQRARSLRVLSAAGRAKGRQGAHLRKPDRAGSLNAMLLRIMREATGGLTILKDRQVKEARALLLSSGYRSRDAIVVYSFFKLTAPAIALAGAALLVYGLDPIGRGPWLDFGAVLGAALLGSRTPDLVLGKLREQRLGAIQKAFPDALDMLVICAEAGLSSDAALKRLVAEASRSESILAQELDITVQELAFLPERRVALENLAERAPLPAINAFVNTMVQAERYGTPLARAFKVLSQELRSQRMMRAEEKAGRLPATMTIPMMLFILPALFIVLIGPAVLDIMDKFIGM